MNDLDDRLSDLLTRAGTAVDVRPDLDAVLADHGAGSPIVDLGRRPRDTRRRLALAAAVLVVVGLAGAALVAGRADERPRENAEAGPAITARFPVFGHLPPDLVGRPVEATEGEGSVRSGLGSSFRPDTPVVRATLGKVAADGTLSDIVQLVAGAEGPDARVGPPPPEVDDLGGGYVLAFGDGRFQLTGPGTIVEVAGGPAAEDLVRSIGGTGLTATVGPDGAPVLAFGDLPDGYTVVAPPTAPEPEQAEALVTGDDGASLTVETGVGPPAVAVLSGGGTARPVDIDGGPGLISAADGDVRVAWTTPSGVTVALTADDSDAETVLAVARDVLLVDEATWRATYSEQEPSTTSTPPTTGPTMTTPGGETGADPRDPPGVDTDDPLVGTVAPPLGGVSLEAYEMIPEDGAWTIVSFTATWCVPCVDMLDTVAPVHRDLAESGRARLVSFFVEDDLDAVRTLVEDHDVDWPVRVGFRPDPPPWGVQGVPTTVFVDPDGVVRGVGVGAMSGRQIDEALTALGG